MNSFHKRNLQLSWARPSGVPGGASDSESADDTRICQHQAVDSARVWGAGGVLGRLGGEGSLPLDVGGWGEGEGGNGIPGCGTGAGRGRRAGEGWMCPGTSTQEGP